MSLLPPKRGDVIRYAYLWADEHKRGRDEALKDRPAVVLALSVRDQDGHTQVLVLAITHAPPKDPRDAIALPTAIKRSLRLDDDLSWVVTSEANAFIWPGPDLRPIPNRRPSTVLYGTLPSKLLQAIARSYLENRKRQLSPIVPRNE